MTTARNPAACMVVAACVAILPAGESPTAEETKHFTVQKINDYVYAFIDLDPTIEWVDGNACAILTDDGVFVVDAHHLPIIAEANIAEIRKITDQPVRYLLNTHWHGDHNTGNSAFVKEYPDIAIIAQNKTYEIMARRMPGWVQRAREGEYVKYIEYFENNLATGKDEDGKVLNANDRERHERLLGVLRRYAADARRAEVVLPNVTFDRQMTLFMGGTEIQVKYAGNANTPGDAFVWLPRDSILITGDILVYPIPYAFGSFFEDWIATLDTMLALSPKVIVPGHGNPMTDTTYLRTVRDMFASFVKQAKRGFANGITTPDSLKQAIDLQSFRRRLAGDNYDRNWAFDNFFLGPATTRILKELKGELGDDVSGN